MSSITSIQQRKKPPAIAQAIALIIMVPIIIGLMLFAFLAPLPSIGPERRPHRRVGT